MFHIAVRIYCERWHHMSSRMSVDLKPENILLHAPGPFPRLIIADFGLARPRAHEQTLNAVGTICYMPPEAIMALTVKGMGYVGIYADAWSLGLVLYAMIWCVFLSGLFTIDF